MHSLIDEIHDKSQDLAKVKGVQSKDIKTLKFIQKPKDTVTPETR